MSRAFPLAARIVFALLCLLTSVYCLLAYIPDTYFAFIQAPFQAWLIWFIRLHAYLFTAALAALSTALLTQYRDDPARRLAIQFTVFFSLVSIFFLILRPFSHLTNNSLSFVWSLAALFPVIWLGTIDHSASGLPHDRLPQVSLRVALFAALAIGILYPGSAVLRNALAGRPVPISSADYWAWLASIAAHILFAVFVVALFNLISSVVARIPNPRLAHFLTAVTFATAVMLIFQRVLLLSIPFAGLEAFLYSSLMGIALVAFVAGLLQLAGTAPEIPDSRKSWRDTPTAHNAAIALLVLAAIYTVPALIGIMDWNSVLAKLWATILWGCVGLFLVQVLTPDLALTRVEGSGRPRYPVWLSVFLIVATYAAYRATQDPAFWPQSLKSHQATVADALGRHATLDASYAALGDLWAVSTEKPCDSLCQFLKQQTGIPASVSVPPVDVKLVETLTPATAKPNIFIFVVDSLRRDYVSPYNPAVTFTPQIQQFAAESVVMKNSFTRYAGTTLSEPAIWAGSLMLHKHYVQPFHPMNNLEKLVDADNYDRYVTVDTVLRLLLNSSPNLHRLDSTMTNWSDQDLCATSLEAEKMLDARTDTSRPIFFYTQPQNIHVVALDRARTLRPPPPGAYPGFNPVAANEIRRIDACFGDFVRYLKAKGLYENSVVVLTADHGESYGDNGHTNHAFGLHPEVLRVPLIFHLPAAMKNYSYDPDAVAFNIDITASLYYLLGHRPIANDPRLGRPLFTLTPEEHESYVRDSYLVAVCYGPIYGILAKNGQSLFVANEMEDEYQYYDLARDPGGINNVINAKIQAEDEHRIRAEVQGIADLYHYQYHHQSLMHWLMQ